jgi:2-polyprenyl-3-methyl-5-hydroxy-6-metoxy-1,4-benzoquinol methylase
VAYARRHYPLNSYVRGTVEEADLGGREFDAVYCSEVIEHAPDCRRFVAALTRVMRPNALLYLTTPDISHWRVPRDLNRWDAFCPPAHCLFFSPGNLTRLLADFGIRVERKLLAIKPGIKILARKVSGG